MKRNYYSASEARAKLGLSKAMFFRKVNEGVIPKVVLLGMKQGVYATRDIDALALSMNMVFEQDDKIVFSRSTPADQVEEMNIGVKCFRRDFITPLPERIAFQQKSDYTFHSLKVNGQTVGYISMFRLPQSLLEDLLTGRRIERDITVKDVLPFTRLEPFSIYIDVVAIDPSLPTHMRRFYAGILVSRFIDLVLNLIANDYQITHIYTVTSTVEGERLVKRLDFRYLDGKSIAPARKAYEYVLDPARIQHLRALSSRGVK